VTQGQFLGVVDNTGQSWGHHLHFQVQVPLYGDNYYWGKSVDITFDDVDINGGRPRVINSFCDDSFYCTYPGDVCDDFRAEYVSQNVPTDDNTPPDGDILNPINGITVYSNTLRLEGWATDEGSGLDNAQFRARYNGTWHDVGPPFDTSLFGHTWNLCADNVPDGPISISMTLRDKNGNQTSDFPGLRHFTKHYACNPVVLPPGCTPRSNEVALFSEVNYGGTCQILGEGSHRSGITLGAVGDNNTDSILIGDQVAATLFTEVNYSSRAESLTRSDANLNENLTGVNTLSSLKVYSIEEPPSTPYPIFPESGSTYTDTDSLSLIWRDAGGATHFRTRLQSTSTSITTPWQIQPYWNIGSLITGTYTWTLQASTPFSNSMWSQPYTFTVQKNPIPHTIKFTSPFSDSLEGSTDGWSKSGLWNLSDDGSKAHSGTHSWWYGQLDSGSYDSGNTLNQGDLTTPVITLPVTTTNYLMQFWYQYESESEHIHWDQRWVQISIDQEPYTNVLQLYDDPMGGWLKTSIDLSPYISAIMTHTLQARFHFSTMDAIDNTFSGWLIDDVQILASQSLACNVDDEPNDSSVQAIPINYGDSLTGSICPQGDHDYFKFTGELGDRLVADIDAKSEGSTLDSFLFLIDEDGSSVLAEHDDELLGVRQDPHLGYVLPRDGDYYLLLRAWDNPQGIGDYNLSLIKDHQDPSLVIAYPENEGFLPNSTITIQTVPNDQESGIQSIRFLWHSGDWADDDWIDLGIDEDGDDGWGVNFDAASPEEQDQVAFYAYAYDWAGNWHASGVWDIAFDHTPPDTSADPLPNPSPSTALHLQWSATDNISGIDHFDLRWKEGSEDWYSETFDGKETEWWLIGDAGVTYTFRIRAEDNANNIETFNDGVTLSTMIPPIAELCSSPDPWDSSGDNDNTPSKATIMPGPAYIQIHNFCNPLASNGLNDHDWFVFNTHEGQRYIVNILPLVESAAVTISLYSSDGATLVEEVTPNSFGQPTSLDWIADQDELVYIKLHHLDGRVAGNDVSYQLTLYKGHIKFFPIVKK
jgi:hypothetical protein